jgi:DNA polymerase III delta subunit
LSIEKRCSASPPTCLYEEFSRPRDYEIAKWLVANTPRLIGRRISEADAEYLADRVGYDLDALHSELQKIDLNLGRAR